MEILTVVGAGRNYNMLGSELVSRLVGERRMQPHCRPAQQSTITWCAARALGVVGIL
jgi:hypothetical protein